jgi:hypothetical protein
MLINADTYADPPVPSGSDTLNDTLSFTVALDQVQQITLTASINSSGPGEAWIFVDPLPELDVNADPTLYGLPADWASQVTLELSPGAKIDAGPDDSGGSNSGGTTSTGGNDNAGGTTGAGDDNSGGAVSPGGADDSVAEDGNESSGCSLGSARSKQQSVPLFAAATLAALLFSRRRSRLRNS